MTLQGKRQHTPKSLTTVTRTIGAVANTIGQSAFLFGSLKALCVSFEQHILAEQSEAYFLRQPRVCTGREAKAVRRTPGHSFVAHKGGCLGSISQS